MKFLKGFALFILGFLLSLSIFIFGSLFMVNQTALNPDFVISQVDKIDIASVAEEMVNEQIPPEAEEFMGKESVGEMVNNTITDLEPWLKEQARNVTYAFYDYLEERSQHLSVEIPLETIKESLRDNLWQAFLESPPPEAAGLSPAEMEQYFNEHYQQISQDIPSTFEIDETSIPSEGMTLLEQARQYIDYFHLAYWGLIGLILLLILLIVLIHHQVRGATRGLGIIFLTDGAITLIGVLLAKNLVGPQLAKLDMPASLQTWIPQFFSDILAPLQWYSIGLLAAGVVLLIVSFVYKPRQASPYTVGL
jgi:hypothetical protein